MNPNFKSMNKSDLRAYILQHREDEDAFYEFMDRLKINPSTKSYPCPNTPENEEITRQAIEEKIEKLKNTL